MIGRLRAAWDEAGRLANHRRGTNPMTRDEWKSAELRQGEILAHVEVLAEMHPELLRAMHLLRDLLNGLGEVRDGESQMLDSLISRKCVRVHCECGRLLGVLAGAVVAHESSPPCGGADAHSVGDRLVTGVETAAPVTDATNEEITDLANLLEEFHERGESWLTMAKTARHIFRGSGPQTA